MHKNPRMTVAVSAFALVGSALIAAGAAGGSFASASTDVVTKAAQQSPRPTSGRPTTPRPTSPRPTSKPTTSRPAPTTSRPAPTTSRPQPIPSTDDPNVEPLPQLGQCSPLTHQVVVAPFSTSVAGEEIVINEPLMLAGCIANQIPSTPMVLMLEQDRGNGWVKVADSTEWETPGRINYLATQGKFRWTVRANTLWGGTGVVTHNY